MRYNSILNKKGFTLLELLIAVSIFGIISVMTFSIINYVPKLAKTESSQYSERTYVRRALTEITDTIQSASEVASPPLEFTMPGGEKISYVYSAGNVNEVVNGTSHMLMQSVDEFSITPTENHLFDIHIKTSKERKSYDFKVERRRGGNIKTNAEISTITPKTAVFDKNPLQWQDISITLNLNGNNLECLWNGENKLNADIDYSINGNILTIKKEYLKDQINGFITIVFDVSNGVDPELSIEIINTTTYLKIAGNSYADGLVRMIYPGNLQIDPEDNTSVLTVTNATLDSTINNSDVSISGLPSGISYTAAKGTGNSIVITLSGTASAPVTDTKSLGIIINSTSANESGVSVLNSDPIEVLLLPGAYYAPPEQNLVFTNEIVMNSNVTITGDIVVGRGTNMTNVNNQTNIYGYVYVDSSLTTNDKFTLGTALKPEKLFVKGSATFQKDTTINGDLFYRDTLTVNGKLNITGIKEQRAVEIPAISIPGLKSKQWYIDNGYTIVNSSTPKVTLVDNGKYYFEIDCNLNSPISGLDNVTIVGTKSITFNKNFSGSGILFAPYGNITINDIFTFTGMCISQSTVLNRSSTLTFKRYAELPFD